MRRATVLGVLFLVLASVAGGPGAGAASKPKPLLPATFDRTVTAYVAEWNALQRGLVEGTALEAVERIPGAYGNEVSPSVPIYLVAKTPHSPIQAIVVPISGVGGHLQTPARILAAAIGNLFPDLVTEREMVDAFGSSVLPALDHGVPLKTPVTMDDLVDFHADVVGSAVVFVATPVGAKVPALARKLAARAKPIPAGP